MQSESLTRQQKIVSFFGNQAQTSQAVAAAAERFWTDFELPLRRMIGPIGVASLFERCVELNKIKYPWLPADKFSHFSEDAAFQLIWRSLHAHSAAIATSASIDLFSTLFELLTLLIGEPLTARVFSINMQDADLSDPTNNDK